MDFLSNVDPQIWPAYTNFDQSPYFANPGYNPHGWLFGDLVQTQAPPASWTGLAQRPYVEEFIPPNAPQAMGVADKRMLYWPTGKARVDLSGADEPCTVQDVGDRSNLMHLPYFRQRVLKHNQRSALEVQDASGSDTLSDDKTSAHLFEKVFRTVRTDWQSTSDISPLPIDSNPVPPAIHTHQQVSAHQTPNIHQLPHEHNIQIHLQTIHTTRSSTMTYPYPLPASLISPLPRVTHPLNPDLLRSTLHSLTPTIIYTIYTCDLGCRSCGICVHYSFMLGGRSVPDGLICGRCKRDGIEKGVVTERMCAAHVGANGVYLAEDLLVTKGQEEVAREMLGRGLAGDWDGVAGRRIASVEK